jgi:N-methylhydantoinase A
MAQLVAVDIGGTFTDLIVAETDGQVRLAKVPTTPDDPAAGVRNALERAGIELAGVSRFFHGTTLGVNTLLEGKGAPTGLITTRGFRDVLEIGRMTWPMYRLHWDKPPPVIPRRLRQEVGERVRADGTILTALDEDAVRAAARSLLDAGAESVAVCFINAYANPVHEARAAELLGAEFPALNVTVSHELTREFREYERATTTAVDALVRPRLSRYLASLSGSLEDGGLAGPLLITRSDGGVMGVDEATRRGVRTLLSGPASGVMGVAALAAALELPDVIAADMGGTSFDAALVVGGEPVIASAARIRDAPLLMPVVEMATIGSGGGSIARIDAAGALEVGPESAGAVPGPICYGRGGAEPTFTDAAVVSGLLDPGFFLGGELPIDVDAARRGIKERIAQPLGLDVVDAASGIVALAEAKMAATLEEITVGKGFDPREFTLVAYGGGGPLVANALAVRLGIPTVVVPILPGAFSAWGMLTLDLVRDYAVTRIARLDGVEAGELDATFAALEAEAEAAFDEDEVPADLRRLLRSIDMRYENQEHTLTVRAEEHLTPEALRQAFDLRHEATYGYALRDPVEIVTYRVRGVAALDKPSHPAPRRHGGQVDRSRKGTRAATHRESGGRREWAVYDRALLDPGDVMAGPAIIEEPSATTVVLPGSAATVDRIGNLVLGAAAP